MLKTTEQKGDLLEKIVGQLCSSIRDAKIEVDVKVTGKSGTVRQVDTLITGIVGVFQVKIFVDSKNYSSPVDIKEVESMIGMVDDVRANLGVIICPSGFTEGAKNRAGLAGVQLYEIYDKALDNSNLFIPLRYVEARISSYNFEFSEKSRRPFSIPLDFSGLLFYIQDEAIKSEDIPVYIWNHGMVAQKAGQYSVKIGAVKITDIQGGETQYCDLNVGIEVVEDYYLKIFPASFIRKVDESGKEYFNLEVDVYQKKQDMIKNGWKYFETLQEMNKAADIENQPQGIRGLLLREQYGIRPAEGVQESNKEK